MQTQPASEVKSYGELGLRILTATLLIPVVTWAVFSKNTGLFLGLVVLTWAMGLSEIAQAASRATSAARHMKDYLIATVILTLGMASLILLRYGSPDVSLGSPFWANWKDAGSLRVFLCLLAVWSTDTAAFVIGKTLGGPKLAPRLSPKKTWSGAVGACVVAGLVVAWLRNWIGISEVPTGLVLGIILAIMTQSGDLTASWMKRRVGIKDFGTALPGHGGVLDRVDGLTLAAPTAYLFWRFLISY